MEKFSDQNKYNFKCEVRLELLFPVSKTEEQTKAGDEHPLQCNLCFKYFEDKNELKVHVKTENIRVILL